MLDAPLRRIVDPPLDRLAARLAARGLGADRITLIGFGIGVLGIAAIMAGQYLTALALLAVNRAADGLDGAVARQTAPSDLGGFLDIVFDFLIYAGVVFAFALVDPPANALPAAFLLFAFIGTGSSFLAFAVMAAKRNLSTDLRGRKSLYYLGGLTEGTETMLFFLAALLLPERFPLLAVGFGCLCWLTVAARIAAGWRMLAASGR